MDVYGGVMDTHILVLYDVQQQPSQRPFNL